MNRFALTPQTARWLFRPLKKKKLPPKPNPLPKEMRLGFEKMARKVFNLWNFIDF